MFSERDHSPAALPKADPRNVLPPDRGMMFRHVGHVVRDARDAAATERRRHGETVNRDASFVELAAARAEQLHIGRRFGADADADVQRRNRR
jgi:hypothetical protein